MSAYTLYDSKVALWICNTDGSTGPRQFIGECQPESLTISEQWEQLQSVSHGLRNRRRFTGERSFELSLSSVLITRLDSDGQTIYPAVDPDQTYFLVVRYYSPETQSWTKETFTGVKASTGPSWQSSGAQFDGSFEFFAERRFRSGRWGEALPDLSPDVSGSVRYVSPGASLELYEYHFLTSVFTATGSNTSLAGISEGGSSVPSGAQWYIQIGGDVVLYISGDDELTVSALDADGIFDGVSGTRVEFILGSDVVAIVDDAGVLYCRDFEEGSEPGRDFDFVAKSGGDWLASFGVDSVVAAEIIETGLT